MRTAAALARACHPASTAAVTVLAVLLAVAAGHGPGAVLLLGAAVLTGQLVIGWSNDLLDVDRDRAVARSDKPLVTGQLTVPVIRAALAGAGVVCVVLSLAAGIAAGLTHLALVGWGVAYNLGLKATVWSWLPYAAAFASLPAVVWLALSPARLPAGWVLAVGALLGVGAHLLNTLPDLAEDAVTGVRGLPHRLGARRSSLLAVLLLVAGTVLVVLGPASPTPWWAWLVLGALTVLATGALLRGGRAPFRAALVVALADVALLLARS